MPATGIKNRNSHSKTKYHRCAKSQTVSKMTRYHVSVWIRTDILESAFALLGANCHSADSYLCEEDTRSCAGDVLACSDTTGDDGEVCNGFDNDRDSAVVGGCVE